MKNLVGKECSCIFDLPFTDWPIAGFPAYVRVLAWEPPMVEMVSVHGLGPVWVNAGTIKTIRATGERA